MIEYISQNGRSAYVKNLMFYAKNIALEYLRGVAIMIITLLPILLNSLIVFSIWHSETVLWAQIVFTILVLIKLTVWFWVVLGNEVGAVRTVGLTVCYALNLLMILHFAANSVILVLVPCVITFIMLTLWSYVTVRVPREKKEGSAK